MEKCARVSRKSVTLIDEFDGSIGDYIGLHDADIVDSRSPQNSLNMRMAAFEIDSTYIVDSRTRETDQDDSLQGNVAIYPCTQASTAIDYQPAAKYFLTEGGGNIGQKQSDHIKQLPKLHTSFDYKKSDYLLEKITSARLLNEPASPTVASGTENRQRLTPHPIQRPKIAQQYSSRPGTTAGSDLLMSRPKTSKPSTAMSCRRDNKSRRQSRPYKEDVCSTDHRYDFIQSRKLVGSKMHPHHNNVKALDPKHIIYREFSYNPEEMAILDYYLNNLIYLESGHGHGPAETSYSNHHQGEVYSGAYLEETPSELFRYQFQPFLPLSMKLRRALKAPRSPSELKKINLTYMVDKANTMLRKFPVVEAVDDSFNVSDGNTSAVESKYTIYHTLDRMHRPSRYNSQASAVEEKDFIDMIASPAIARRPSSSSTGHATKLDSTLTVRRASCPNDDDAVCATRIQSICSSEPQEVAAPVTSSPLANRRLKVVVKLESTHCYNTYDDLQLDQMINHAAEMVDSMSCRLID
jgi:hypothetical protein